MKPMLASPTDPRRDSFADLVGDGWVLQQKLDGRRLVVASDGAGTVSAFNRSGEPTFPPPEVAAVLAGVSMPVVFDGEQVGGTYTVFDMPEAARTVTAGVPLEARLAVMYKLVEFIGLPVAVARTAVSIEEKQAMIDAVQSANAEGWIAKRRGSLYEPGRRAQSWRKIKRTRSIDCVVEWLGTPETTGKQNMGLSLYRGGELVSVGECGRLTGDGHMVKAGDVVEVQILYVSDDDRLYQPTRPRLRDDKTATECTWDQLEPNKTDKTLILTEPEKR